jgi:xanthine dehydrogenase accessory factor
MIELLKTLNTWIEAGHPTASATIVTHEGSTPRSSGSKMLLRPDGVMHGTVGGGLVEAQVLTAAEQVLKDGQARLLDFDLTGEMAAGADMVCGGKLRVFLERISPGPEAALFVELAARLEIGEGCLLATPLLDGGRSLLCLRGPALGAELSEPLAESMRRSGADIKAPILFEDRDASWFLEPWRGPSPLFIAGAGHVSRPTALMAAMTGFRVVVMDDRPEFANADRFPAAHEISVCDQTTCLQDRQIGPESSVVIVTRGHVHDAVVLAQALRTTAGYIGMIGSRRKRDSVYARLRQQGFGDADFARVRCPIGLEIRAETPEEIAVSILAELIQVRAERQAT